MSSKYPLFNKMPLKLAVKKAAPLGKYCSSGGNYSGPMGERFYRSGPSRRNCGIFGNLEYVSVYPHQSPSLPCDYILLDVRSWRLLLKFQCKQKDIDEFFFNGFTEDVLFDEFMQFPDIAPSDLFIMDNVVGETFV
jgi:hypothetical protein